MLAVSRAAILNHAHAQALPEQNCQTLDDETLEHLVISSETHSFLPLILIPGRSEKLSLRKLPSLPVDACVVWSVSALAGTHIDPVTGILVLSERAPRGKTLTVTANIENGRKTLTEEVIIPRVGSPIGVWEQDAQFVCRTGKPQDAFTPIKELVLFPDGKFNVTWFPYETFIDYTGTYSVNPHSRQIRFEVGGGTHAPSDFRGDGRVYFDNQGRMNLRGVWLGTKPQLSFRFCGMRFRRI